MPFLLHRSTIGFEFSVKDQNALIALKITCTPRVSKPYFPNSLFLFISYSFPIHIYIDLSSPLSASEEGEICNKNGTESWHWDDSDHSLVIMHGIVHAYWEAALYHMGRLQLSQECAAQKITILGRNIYGDGAVRCLNSYFTCLEICYCVCYIFLTSVHSHCSLFARIKAHSEFLLKCRIFSSVRVTWNSNRCKTWACYNLLLLLF